MSENDIEVKDHRKVKQDELGPAAVIRTTTLKPKDSDEKPKASKTKTPAQQAVAAAKAHDEGRPESAIADEPKKKKAPAPAWSSTNTAAKDRKIDAPDSRANAPTTPTKNPLEEMELTNFDDGLNWCHCGRALYGREIEAGQIVMCRDGHEHNDHTQRLSWEDAARLLRTEQSAIQTAILMGAKASDIAAFFFEEDARAAPEPRPEVTTAEQPTPTEQKGVSEIHSAEQPNTEQPLPTTQEMLSALMGAAPPMEAASHMTPVELQLTRDIEALTDRVASLERVNLALLESVAGQQLFAARAAYQSGADFEVVKSAVLAHEKLARVLEEMRASRAKRMDPMVWATVLAALAATSSWMTTCVSWVAGKPAKE